MYIFLIEAQRQKTGWLPAFYTALVNSRFSLTCIFDNWNRIMEWVWLYQGGPLPYNTIMDNFPTALTNVRILKVQQFNAGTYTCAAYKGNEKVYSRSMYLAVIGE